MDAPACESRITRDLAPGERLLWSGRPRQGLLFGRADLFLVPFSLVWCGFMVFFFVAAARHRETPPLFKVVGFLFLLIGIQIIAGRFVVDVVQRRRKAYGVTTARVILVSGLFRETVESLPLRGISQLALTVRSDGSGAIVFGPGGPVSGFAVPGWPGAGQFLPPAFEGIPAAREVHELIGRAQAGTA